MLDDTATFAVGQACVAPCWRKCTLLVSLSWVDTGRAVLHWRMAVRRGLNQNLWWLYQGCTKTTAATRQESPHIPLGWLSFKQASSRDRPLTSLFSEHLLWKLGIINSFSVPLRCKPSTTQECLSQWPGSHPFEMWSARQAGLLAPSFCERVGGWLWSLKLSRYRWPHHAQLLMDSFFF